MKIGWFTVEKIDKWWIVKGQVALENEYGSVVGEKSCVFKYRTKKEAVYEATWSVDYETRRDNERLAANPNANFGPSRPYWTALGKA